MLLRPLSSPKSVNLQGTDWRKVLKGVLYCYIVFAELTLRSIKWSKSWFLNIHTDLVNQQYNAATTSTLLNIGCYKDMYIVHILGFIRVIIWTMNGLNGTVWTGNKDPKHITVNQNKYPFPEKYIGILRIFHIKVYSSVKTTDSVFKIDA